MNRMHIVCTVLACFSLQVHGLFSSLPNFVSYAAHAQEYPEIDNTDWEHPDFSSFYKSQLPSGWSRLKGFFGLKKNLFDLQEFEQILQQVTAQRKGRNFHGDFVQKIVPGDPGRLIVFGDLRGAFHSLVRSLQQLVSLDVLSKDLVVQEGGYIVFNGNLINGAAYNLETLMTALVLMQKNPDHVIYIRGQNEQAGKKEELDLYRKLKVVAGDQADRLFAEITAFFDTLPLALYVTKDPSGALKIFSQSSDQFADKKLGSFLSASNKAQIVHADELKKDDVHIEIEAVIRAHDFSRTLGLKRYVGPPVTWQVFSSPTGVHRRLYGFFRDTFAVVDTAVHFHDWLITLYAQDLQEGGGYRDEATYNLSTGVFISGKQIDFFDNVEIRRFEEIIQGKKKLLADLKEACKKPNGAKPSGVSKVQADVSKQKQVLVVGTSLDLSKGAKNIGKKINETLAAALVEKNSQGGVRGVSFQGIFLDDAYTPEIARQNFLKLVNELKVDILLAPFGTATTLESLDLLRDNKMILLFPAVTEARSFRTSELKNAVSLSVSYYEQGKALIDYIFGHYKPKKIALFYQNDGFGKDGLEGALAALKKLNFAQIIELPYERNQVDFSSQKNIVEQELPDVIGFFSLPFAASEFMKSLGAASLSSKILFGISDLRDNDLLQFLHEKGLSLIYANSLPDWQPGDMRIAQDYKRFAADNNITPDPFSFEVYVVAQIFFYLIEQVEGPVTKEKILRAAEKIKNLNFKGLPLNFNPDTRVLLNAVWLAKTGVEPWVKVELETPKAVAPEKTVTEKIAEVKAEDEKPLQALHGDLLMLGNTADVSKGLKAMSDALRQGFELKMKDINAQGGINNIKLKIAYLDDGYIPENAKKNVETFLSEYNTNLFIGSVGTPTLESYINLVKDGKIAVFFPFTGSSTFRTSEFKNLLHYSSSYDETTGAATNYILNKFSPKRWALLYQNDTFGTVPKDAVKRLLEKHNIKDVVEVPFNRNDVNFTQQAKDIVAFKPEVIGFFGPAVSAEGFIRTAGTKDLANKILYGLPWLAGDKLQTFLREKGLKMIIPCSVPNPKTSELPIVKEFRLAAENAGIALDVNALEGYVDIAIFAYLLKQVEGQITIEKIMQAAEKIKDLDFGGLKLNFDPSLRVLSQYTWLDLGAGQEWVQIDLGAERAK